MLQTIELGPGEMFVDGQSFGQSFGHIQNAWVTREMEEVAEIFCVPKAFVFSGSMSFKSLVKGPGWPMLFRTGKVLKKAMRRMMLCRVRERYRADKVSRKSSVSHSGNLTE